MRIAWGSIMIRVSMRLTTAIAQFIMIKTALVNASAAVVGLTHLAQCCLVKPTLGLGTDSDPN